MIHWWLARHSSSSSWNQLVPLRPRSNGSKLPAPCTAIWLQRWGLSHHRRGDAPRLIEVEVSEWFEELVSFLEVVVLSLKLEIFNLLFVSNSGYTILYLIVRTLNDLMKILWCTISQKGWQKALPAGPERYCGSLATICSHDAQAWVSDVKCKCYCAHSTRRLESSQL